MAELKMIVGLGNPGPQYSRNRHNIGFQCVELCAQRWGIALDRLQMRAQTGNGFVTRDGLRQKVLLVKPLTFMNASGEAVAPLARFYRIEPSSILVIHDDLDLPAGKLRLRPGGSSGGQRGVQSIIEQLGTQEFPRIRVGIGRPPNGMDPAAYVLQNFSEEEEVIFTPLRARIVEAAECWLFEGVERAMNRFNG
ncbi:aminoacyl-tRNA hydrolase [Caldilinea sp.]|jgi:PTH1 family peptidyl-tRNA hydrolase|uniref:aminoacyl-tRNA hydrolase n=1 Tax=Caldilinea sp. TaxID=2293560 RepID=UPI00261A0523|nr:aminoacyl-tRNA hydrolase [Caldilinea sp.]